MQQWFSTLGLRPQRVRERFLEGSRVDILHTLLHYICFIRILDGVLRLEWGYYNGPQYKNDCKPLPYSVQFS